MARPIKSIDTKVLEGLAKINCTYEEISAVLGIDPSTLTRRYAHIIKEGREKGKMSLKRAMWKNAIDKENVAMQIFLSKNLLEYSDRNEVIDKSDAKKIILQYSLPKLEKKEELNDEKRS